MLGLYAAFEREALGEVWVGECQIVTPLYQDRCGCREGWATRGEEGGKENRSHAVASAARGRGLDIP